MFVAGVISTSILQRRGRGGGALIKLLAGGKNVELAGERNLLNGNLRVSVACKPVVFCLPGDFPDGVC